MIRLYDPAKDVPALTALGEKMHNESDYKHLEYHPMEILRSVNLAPDLYRCWVAEEDNEIYGMLVAIKHPHMFCYGTCVTELILYVTPEKRGGLAAYRLVKKLRQWADDEGAVEVSAGISTGVNVERTSALYQRLGFSEVGPILKIRR